MGSTKFGGVMLGSVLSVLAGTQGVLAEELNLYTTREPG